MFSWAASTFESIVQTVAPPSDPNYKFVTFCQQSNEHGAIECLRNPQSMSTDGSSVPPIDPVRTIIVQVKGQTALHLACLYTLPQVFDYILQNNDLGANVWHVLDADGNTPFHSACMSNSPKALDFIKKMLMYGNTAPAAGSTTAPPTLNTSLVMAKNSQGESPYDVAVLNSIRQYLLPIQLQAETQAALDNGGVGLPPGLDLGGAKVSYSNLPPPPSTTTILQGSGFTAGALPGTNSRYAPPPMPVMGDTNQQAQSQQHQPPYLPPSATTTTTTNATGPPLPPIQQQFPPAPIVSNYPPVVVSNPPPQPSPTVTESSPTDPSPPPPPNSGGYSLVGRSSAAIYKGSGGRVLPNDGFHSSSSDKNLQAKYGHASLKPGVALPPPPSSGNAPMSGGYPPGSTQSAPPSSNGPSGYNNPFAAGGAALANRRVVSGTSRYPGYDPIRGMLPPPPPPASVGAAQSVYNPTASTPPNFSIFAPPVGIGGSSNTENAAVTSGSNTSTGPVQQTTQQAATTAFGIPPLPPPPSIGSRTAMFHRQGSSGASPVISSPNPHLLVQPTPANTPIDQPTRKNSTQLPLNPSSTTPATMFAVSPAPSSGNAANIFSSPPGSIQSTPEKGPNGSMSSPPGTTVSPFTAVPTPTTPFSNVPSQQNSTPNFTQSPSMQATSSGAVALFSTPSKVDAMTTFAVPPSDPSSGTNEQTTESLNSSDQISSPVSSTPLDVVGEVAQDDAPSVQTEIQHDDDDDDEGIMDDIPLTPWTDQQKLKLDPFSTISGGGQKLSAANVFGSSAVPGTVSAPPPPFPQR